MKSALNLPDKFVIYDTEYTTWDGAPERKWSGPGEHRELVQIGAIIVDGLSMNERESFEMFVNPRLNPTLSDFFVTLTDISQKEVDARGVDFGNAWNTFSS